MEEPTLTVMSGAGETAAAMPAPQVTERLIPGLSGLAMLGVCMCVGLGGAGLLVWGGHGVPRVAGIVLVVLGGLAGLGLTPVAPGEARVLQLFGGYDGTVRATGLRWVNPLTRRIRVSRPIKRGFRGKGKEEGRVPEAGWPAP